MTIRRISCLFVPVSEVKSPPPPGRCSEKYLNHQFLPPVHLNHDRVVNTASGYRLDAPGFESQ